MKKIIILKIIPIISSILSYILVTSKFNIQWLTTITFILAFLGFIFFFIGKKYKNNRLIKILSILDILSTVYVILFYTVAIFSFGL